MARTKGRTRQIKRKWKAAKAELDVAGTIQRQLFPQTSPQIPGFEIAGACQPAEETGGDFFDYLKMADGTLGLAVGDVSGHGLGPAILAADARAYLRAFAKMEASPGRILAHTNELLWQDTRGERFVTVFLASLHSNTRTIRFAAAGHRAFVFNADGGVTTLESPQPPLGWDPAYVSDIEHRLTLQVGGLLFVMTDGVDEAISTPGPAAHVVNAFGKDRALETVRQHRDDSARSILQELFQQVREFTRGRPQEDDMAAVVLKAVEP